MKVVNLLILGVGLLAGCVWPQDPLAQYQQVDRWNATELHRARAQLQQLPEADMSDSQRLQLATLTAYNDPSNAGLDEAQQLLDMIPTGSATAPLRDALQRELRLLAEREQFRARSMALTGQLSQALQHSEQLEQELADAASQITVLRLQLEALKNIDNDISAGQLEQKEKTP